MNRLEKFISLKDHPMLGITYKKLSAVEIGWCVHYLEETKQQNNDEFIHQVNRLGVTHCLELKQFKRHSDMWALLSQCIEVKVRERRA
jgi:hypothetical protein